MNYRPHEWKVEPQVPFKSITAASSKKRTSNQPSSSGHFKFQTTHWPRRPWSSRPAHSHKSNKHCTGRMIQNKKEAYHKQFVHMKGPASNSAIILNDDNCPFTWVHGKHIRENGILLSCLFSSNLLSAPIASHDIEQPTRDELSHPIEFLSFSAISNMHKEWKYPLQQKNSNQQDLGCINQNAPST